MVLPENQQRDQQYMEAALQLARQAPELGEVPVGAVVVHEGNIIASAHNRRELDQDPCAHAELLAMRLAAQAIGSWRLEGCTVYVTLEPCAMCAGAMVLARIERCVYGCSDPKGGFLGTLGDLPPSRPGSASSVRSASGIARSFGISEKGRSGKTRRDGRVDEGGRFEIYCRATYRGFESHSLRTAAFLLPLSLRRGDRVDEGARLERVCRATYRGFESHSLRQLHWS